MKYLTPACARPPPGAAGSGRRRLVRDELHHTAAERVPPLRPAGEFDFALKLQLKESLVEGDHRVEVGGDETNLDAGREQVEPHGHLISSLTVSTTSMPIGPTDRSSPPRQVGGGARAVLALRPARPRRGLRASSHRVRPPRRAALVCRRRKQPNWSCMRQDPVRGSEQAKFCIAVKIDPPEQDRRARRKHFCANNTDVNSPARSCNFEVARSSRARSKRRIVRGGGHDLPDVTARCRHSRAFLPVASEEKLRRGLLVRSGGPVWLRTRGSDAIVAKPGAASHTAGTALRTCIRSPHSPSARVPRCRPGG